MDRNGYFSIINRDDGIYLKGINPIGNGAKTRIEDAMYYLDKKNIKEYDIKGLNTYISGADFSSEFKINDKKGYPENEHIKLDIESQGLKVVGRFYPPSNDGSIMTKDEIIQELRHYNIMYGYVMKNIDIFVRMRLYCTDILLARSLAPVHGHSASIEYFFNTNVVAKPKLNEDGTVDFHQLGNISHVSKDDRLAHLTPADPGVPGKDIHGRVIPPKKVENKILRHGRNIHLSEDKLDMYSDVSGHVTLVDNTVFVSDTYEVPANVDTSTGDIEYDGNVLIKGNVNTGYTVKASGSISVNGVVEGATLIAGGDINLRLGVQGIFKAKLEAGGNIVSKFFENCPDVKAGGSISTDAIMHSTVKAKGDIIVKGKRGLISGGEVVSGTMIQAKTVGSHMETPTFLEVGIDPAKMDRLHFLEKDSREKTDEIERIMQVLALYKKRMKSGYKPDAEKMKAIRESNVQCTQYAKDISEAKVEMDDILAEIDECKSGKILVSGDTNSGVTITIARVIYKVKDSIVHTRFVKDGPDIRLETY